MWRLYAGVRELVGFLGFLLWVTFSVLLIALLFVALWFASGGNWLSLIELTEDFDTIQRLQLGGVVFVVATLLIAWRNLRNSRRIAILNKRADVIQNCAKRYDDLYRERSAISTDLAAKHWFSRLWGLKSDQLDFYLAGWVDIDTLRSWVYSTYALIARDEEFELQGQSLRESWEAAASYHRDVNPMFYEMMKRLFRAWDARRDPSIAAPLCDALLIQLDRKSVGEREMVQRRYGVSEYLSRIKRLTVFDLDEAFRYVDRNIKSYKGVNGP